MLGYPFNMLWDFIHDIKSKIEFQVLYFRFIIILDRGSWIYKWISIMTSNKEVSSKLICIVSFNNNRK